MGKRMTVCNSCHRATEILIKASIEFWNSAEAVVTMGTHKLCISCLFEAMRIRLPDETTDEDTVEFLQKIDKLREPEQTAQAILSQKS